MTKSDLIYFGYTWEEDSKKAEDEFLAEFKPVFENVKIESAYDDIKGYRQAIEYDESIAEDIMVWLIAFGWGNCSFHIQMMMLQDQEKLVGLCDKAKDKYPDQFKKDEY